MTDEKKFSTRDIYLASTLITLHFLHVDTEYQFEGLKTKAIGYFNFIESDELREARNKYNQGLVLVEPRAFMNNLQSLKAEVTNFIYNPSSDYNKRGSAVK